MSLRPDGTNEHTSSTMSGELWWNVFASKACQLLRALGSVMVLVVLGVIGLTYYTTVVLVYGPLAGEDSKDGKFATVVLVVYHFLILMVLWSYFACVLTEPGRVPEGWIPPPEVSVGHGERGDSYKVHFPFPLFVHFYSNPRQHRRRRRRVKDPTFCAQTKVRCVSRDEPSSTRARARACCAVGRSEAFFPLAHTFSSSPIPSSLLSY